MAIWSNVSEKLLYILICESCSLGIQVSDHSFRKQSNCEDMHEDEVVMLDSILPTDSIVSDKESLLSVVQFLFLL